MTDRKVKAGPGFGPPLKIVRDELARSIARARKGNPVDTLAKLLAEESRWRRKRTIAENKLAEVRDKVKQFAQDLARASTEPEGKP